MVRVLFFAFVIALVLLIYKYFTTSAKSERCPRCHGLGYWEGTRNKETCDRCHGSGRIPKV